MDSTEEISTESVTTNVKLDEVDVADGSCKQDDVTRKSNGISVDDNFVNPQIDDNADHPLKLNSKPTTSVEDSSEILDNKVESTHDEHENADDSQNSEAVDTTLQPSSIQPSTDESKNAQEFLASFDNKDGENDSSHITEVQYEEIVIETTNESEATEASDVRLETEVLVEINDDSPNAIVEVNDSSNNILTEINQSIESEELLHTSAASANVDNNNSSTGHEMFNKEELIDILEGNDLSGGNKDITHVSNSMEKKMALEQLTRLRNTTIKKKTHKEYKKKTSVKKVPQNVEGNVVRVIHKEYKKKSLVKKAPQMVEENIVHALVRDWEDDDFNEDGTVENDVQVIPEQDSKTDFVVKEEKENPHVVDDQDISINKSSDDGQPQRRLGRLIKKKVIFDPDNPDTFTKGKIPNKNKDPQSEEQPPSKKGKVESTPRAKSKSPVSKLQWKKPSSKTNKPPRRLTEIDRLLMDEGAVNMIYQLTPEAPKGKKNVKTKAEFIKKLQSSTPESKEMKFRERKKECVKSRDEDPKRILGIKHRISLSSSVKSPAISEDFETHSADDSIIYRRHSSSSYSSSCMSPRRLSDVDTTVTSNTCVSQVNETQLKCEADLSETDNKPVGAIINKNDCLSIKKKLNSKLSLALNKRKRDLTKADKIPKKLKLNDHIADDNADLKYLTLKFDQRVAEICVNKTGSKYSTLVLKQISKALQDVDSRTDISVTILTSECGTLCSELDLGSLLNEDIDIRKNSADEIIKSVRELLCAVERHSKMLVTGVWGACSGLALALVALGDAVLAADGATFGLVSGLHCAVISPGIAPLIATSRRLPQSMVDDMVIFDRHLSAFEALQYGLVSRVLPSGGFLDQLRIVAQEMGNQPMQSLILKKKLLKLGRVSESTFLSHLEEERKHMLSYWFSDEGQKSIRNSMKDQARANDRNDIDNETKTFFSK